MGPDLGKHAEPAHDPALDLAEGDLLLLVAICHLRRGDPSCLVADTLLGSALAYPTADSPSLGA